MDERTERKCPICQYVWMGYYDHCTACPQALQNVCKNFQKAYMQSDPKFVSVGKYSLLLDEDFTSVETLPIEIQLGDSFMARIPAFDAGFYKAG